MATKTVSIDELNAMLAPIVGQPLTDMWRALGQIFEFGKQMPGKNKKGNDITKARFHVKFLCEWQISQGPRVILGSSDHRTKRRFFDRVREPKEPRDRDIWRGAKEFFGKVDAGELKVLSIKIESNGLVRIRLTDKYALIGLNCSANHDSFLYWSDDKLNESHLVFWNQNGFETT